MTDKMKKRLTLTAIAFSLLLSAVSAVPLRAFALSGTADEREKVITGSSMEEVREKAEKEFPQSIREGRKSYTLTDIEYTVLKEIYLDKKEKTVELKEEPKQTITEDGTEYELVRVETKEKTTGEETRQIVTAYDDYDYAVTAADVPGSKTVSAVNEQTGEAEQVECTFTGIAPAGVSVIENTMTVTFSNYDSAYYEWNGNYIPRDDSTPPLAGYESQLLASVGAAEGSVVTGWYWASDVYTVDGVQYRDAAATVQQQVQMYRANYQGVITGEEKKETIYRAVYEAPDQDGAVQYEVQASAAYMEDETSYMPYIAAGVGIALLAGLTAMILMLLSKKKKEQEEGGK